MKTKYHILPDEHFRNYFNYLIGKVWKILPMNDNNDRTLHKYIDSLQRELIGNIHLIEDLRCDGYFITLVNKIEFLNSEEYTKQVCKTEVFACIDLIKKIMEKHNLVLEDGDSDE